MIYTIDILFEIKILIILFYFDFLIEKVIIIYLKSKFIIQYNN